MKKQIQKKYHRRVERLLLAASTIILAIMVFSYHAHIKDDFINTEYGYSSGKVVNLTLPVNSDAVTKMLTKGGYFTDGNYIEFITKNIIDIVKRQQVLPNLGALNKKPLLLDATAFEATGTEAGELRFLNSLAHLGMDSALYEQEKKKPVKYNSVVAVQNVATDVEISGTINFADDEAANTASTKGTLVKLTRIFPDAYLDTLADEAKILPIDFYARTDEDGKYRFINLDAEGNYSVLPIKPGFEFGAAKGTAKISNNKEYNFTAKPHQLRLLDAVEYRQIKRDKIFTVRTPQVFKKEFFTSIILFALAFWLLHFALSIKNYRSDQFILPLIMFIISTGIIVLYSVQDALRDEVYGTGMARYSAFILMAFSILVFVFKKNPVNRFYHSAWFDPVYNILPGVNKLKAPRGYSWLIASIFLMLLLAFFGTGPEGSGVKVNIFGFQVTELSKYLMVVFFAAYFTVNAGYFRNIPDNRWLTKNNLLMFALFIFLLVIYAALGDLGPAIVLCITFLFFYSFAKEEFLQMIMAAAIYAVLLFMVYKYFNTPQKDYLPWIAVVACVSTFLYAYFKKKQESVFFITLIISSFILLATLPFEFTQRLADRNGMFANMWENTLTGGDQVAQGIWSLNSGGWLGQGLGKGFSNVMPAHHTDMIIESIGEELGIVALISLFFAFGLLVYRSILSARRTGKPFMFYLMAGIAIATMLQFMLIVAGTLGLVPLTGISVPFLSKGNAGIIVTLIAFMFVLIMSHEKGDALEMEYVKENFDKVNVYAILSFFIAIIIFIGSLVWYQSQSDKYIVKPALVLNKQGDWQYTYNPRIGILLRDIKAGNIYDKNGILLATSNKNTFDSAKTRLLAAGANAYLYNEQLSREQDRYYPFAADLLFWLGDYNKEIAKAENTGYAAEYRHFTALRGFDVKYTATQKTSDRYKEKRFLPETEKETELVKYDYSALAPFIKAGKNSELIAFHNNKQKDIWLSLDVVLNEKLNALIQTKAPYKNFRTSIVALNSNTGDVLASASNPAASYKDMKLISNIDALDYRTIFKQIFGDRIIVPQDMGITYTSRPGSTVKIIDAYAAFNQYGKAAANFSFFVHPAEVIRSGEPVNDQVDMHQAIVKSSNVYFIKLINEKKLQQSLFNLYDVLGMNILNRGGFNFKRPEDYRSDTYYKEWNQFLEKGKSIYHTRNKKLINTKRRFQSHYSNIAWGQGELMGTPLHLAKMSGAIANGDTLQPSRFLYKAWNQPLYKEEGISISKNIGISTIMSGYMKEQSASISAVTGLEVYGKTGSPERDKLVKQGNKTVRKRVTDAWYTFYVYSPKTKAPIAFAIRIEEIGNSDFAKQLAVDMLNDLKKYGYF